MLRVVKRIASGEGLYDIMWDSSTELTKTEFEYLFKQLVESMSRVVNDDTRMCILNRFDSMMMQATSESIKREMRRGKEGIYVVHALSKEMTVKDFYEVNTMLQLSIRDELKDEDAIELVYSMFVNDFVEKQWDFILNENELTGAYEDQIESTDIAIGMATFRYGIGEIGKAKLWTILSRVMAEGICEIRHLDDHKEHIADTLTEFKEMLESDFEYIKKEAGRGISKEKFCSNIISEFNDLMETIKEDLE